MPVSRAARSAALAAGMAAADALGGRRVRLLWCVDLDRDVAPRAAGTARYLCAACSRPGCITKCNPGMSCPVCAAPCCDLDVVSTPSGTTCKAGHGGAPWYTPADDGRGGAWGALLTRLKAALEGQTAGVYECRIAVVVREDLPGVGPCAITVGLPYRVDPSRLAASPPPAGVWRIWPEPEPRPDAKYPEVGAGSHDYGYRHAGDLPEDRLPVPDTFWLDGIPF